MLTRHSRIACIVMSVGVMSALLGAQCGEIIGPGEGDCRSGSYTLPSLAETKAAADKADKADPEELTEQEKQWLEFDQDGDGAPNWCDSKQNEYNPFESGSPAPEMKVFLAAQADAEQQQLAEVGPPHALKISGPNPAEPIQGQGFQITVTLVDADGKSAMAEQGVSVSLAKDQGQGNLDGELEKEIATGESSVEFKDLKWDTAEDEVSIKADAEGLTEGLTDPFAVLDPDQDSDQDGIANAQDNCPSDPNKTEPGTCGCGTRDTDSDDDGTPDCKDDCPTDSTNNCRCVDTDRDGLTDELEEAGFLIGGRIELGNPEPEKEGKFKTDPNNPDSDGDGIPDGKEVAFFEKDDGVLHFVKGAFPFRTNPMECDTDGDGKIDSQDASPLVNAADFGVEDDSTDVDTDGIGALQDIDVDGDGDPELTILAGTTITEANIESEFNRDFSGDGTLDDGFDLNADDTIDGETELFTDTPD